MTAPAEAGPLVRAQLAGATAAAHAALERRLDLERRLVDAAALVATLAVFRGFFAGLEPALARLLPPGVGQERARLPDLDADLRMLGMDEDAVRRLPVAPAPGLDDRDAALGALYVVEGARLGGRLIARHLAAAGIAPAAPLRFWSDDGGHVQERWRSFVALLGTIAPGSDAAAAAERGAVATFEALGCWFAERLPAPDGRPCVAAPRALGEPPSRPAGA